MEIISLNTSLFSSYLSSGKITIKSFWNHYVIGNHIINVQSNPLLNSFPACDIMLQKMYLSGRSSK